MPQEAPLERGFILYCFSGSENWFFTFCPTKKTRVLQVLGQKVLLVSWKPFSLLSPPGGPDRQCGVESFVWMHSRHGFKISFNICMECAAGAKTTPSPSWQESPCPGKWINWNFPQPYPQNAGLAVGFCVGVVRGGMGCENKTPKSYQDPHPLIPVPIPLLFHV